MNKIIFCIVPCYFAIVDENARLCNPFESEMLNEYMSNVPDDKTEMCLSDCDSVDYLTKVTAAPFRRCDYKNFGLSYLCDHENTNDPPIWAQTIVDQYLRDWTTAFFPSYIKAHNETWVRMAGNGEITGSNTRKHVKNIAHQVFPSLNEKSPTYDAFEKDISMVTFFLESTTVYEFERKPIMNVVDFISQVGGLLGLCMGFSMISAIELMYWFTYRMAKKLL